MKAIVIYHSADFDGIFSGLVCNFFLKRGDCDVTLVGWNHGDPTPILDYEGADVIYIVDLAIDALMSRPELKDKIVWIDHHISSINKYDNGAQGYFDNSSVSFAGLRIDGVAACRLCWQYFLNNSTYPCKQDYVDRKVSEPILITLVGEYDVWDKRDYRAELVQLGLGILDFKALSTIVYYEFEDGPSDRFLESCIHTGNIIAQYVDKKNADHATHNAHVVKFEGLNFMCLNGRGNSLSFKSVASPIYDGLMMWFYNGKICKVSLYGNGKDIDLSKIALKYGGGGHRNACGFEIELYRMKDLLNSMYV